VTHPTPRGLIYGLKKRFWRPTQHLAGTKKSREEGKIRKAIGECQQAPAGKCPGLGVTETQGGDQIENYL